jgi:hypothetical protein
VVPQFRRPKQTADIRMGRDKYLFMDAASSKAGRMLVS